jgi:hypothetical protein
MPIAAPTEEELFPGAVARSLTPASAGVLYNAGVADEGATEYAGTSGHSSSVLYLSTTQSAAEAYATAAAYKAGEDATSRLRAFKLAKPIDVLWVHAGNVWMDDEEEAFLVESAAYDGIAQHDGKGNLTELTVKSPFPVVRVADVAKTWAAFVDLCVVP